MSAVNYQFAQPNAVFTPRFISYDSEFVREKNYYPKLALLQLHQPEQNNTHLYDPLSSQSLPWSILLNHPAPIVMHSGRQDLELIYLYTGAVPKSYRDTQIGFALIQPKQYASYAEIVAHYLGVHLSKAQTRSDWLKRPLTNAQLRYAAEDVYYLSQLYPLLCADLQRLKRLDWWQQECEHLLQTTQTHNQYHYHWYHLDSSPKLRGIEITIASILVQAREQVAQQRDLPRRKIASDGFIIDLARQRPNTIESLAELLAPKHLLWTANQMLIEDFSQLDTVYPPMRPQATKLSPAHKQRYQQLLQFRQDCAIALNIAPDLLASNRQLRQLCAQPEEDNPVKKGWRATLFAEQLRQL